MVQKPRRRGGHFFFRPGRAHRMVILASLFQPDKQVPYWSGDGNTVRAIEGGDGITAGAPGGGGQIGILLQNITSSGWPQYLHAVRSVNCP